MQISDNELDRVSIKQGSSSSVDIEHDNQYILDDHDENFGLPAQDQNKGKKKLSKTNLEI